MKDKKISIIGLGYVGLPLAVEFGKKRTVIGYDINEQRINELKKGLDNTLEIPIQELAKAVYLKFTNNIEDIKSCQIFIITVPTPINKDKSPDLTFIKNSTNLVGSILKKGDVVIYESTVYPGVTEDFCVPILEKQSGLNFNKDFYCGYSPERINPGDKNHRLINIKKVTSGSNPKIASEIDDLYKEIIIAGTHKADSIKIAEAAKIIENTQRDLNIALINELAIIFEKLNIDTESVLKAAKTKWNFLPFMPGLVGGHCIGVDPHYLAYKSLEVGHNPEIILSGRRINDSMGTHIINQATNLMIKKGIKINNSNILIMGLTFKENCPDIRNSKIIELIKELESLGCNIDVYDPWVDKNEVKKNLGLSLTDKPYKGKYDLIVLAVSHKDFKIMNISEIRSFGKKTHIIYDVKYLFKQSETDGRL